VKTSVKCADALLELLRKNHEMTLAEVAAAVGRSVRAVEMASSKLVEARRLLWVGPQKGGHWEVLPSACRRLQAQATEYLFALFTEGSWRGPLEPFRESLARFSDEGKEFALGDPHYVDILMRRLAGH
jgi:hypothetical protein